MCLQPDAIHYCAFGAPLTGYFRMMMHAMPGHCIFDNPSNIAKHVHAKNPTATKQRSAWNFKWP
jgi:hypothetical protein